MQQGRKVLFLMLFINFSLLSFSQDPHYSQFYANSLYLNPAFAGSIKCPRLLMSYRNQWPIISSNYITYQVAYDQHVNWLEGGIGLFAMHDLQGSGSIATTTLNGIYSYSLNVSRTFSLKAGFQASYFQKKLIFNHIYPDMLHPVYGPIFSTTDELGTDNIVKTFIDFSVGILGYGKNYFFGFAVHHLTEPIESFMTSRAYLPRKYTLHFGNNIPLSSGSFKKDDEVFISPNILFMQQENFQQINYGLYISRSSIIGGFWFRQNFKPHPDAFIMTLGFANNIIKFLFSYDLTVSKLKNETLGAFEITFSYKFPCNQKTKKFKMVSCPYLSYL